MTFILVWMICLPSRHGTPRPVPLEHYIFPAGGEGLHLVVDNKGRFRENNFQVLQLLRVLPKEGSCVCKSRR